MHAMSGFQDEFVDQLDRTPVATVVEGEFSKQRRQDDLHFQHGKLLT